MSCVENIGTPESQHETDYGGNEICDKIVFTAESYNGMIMVQDIGTPESQHESDFAGNEICDKMVFMFLQLKMTMA